MLTDARRLCQARTRITPLTAAAELVLRVTRARYTCVHTHTLTTCTYARVCTYVSYFNLHGDCQAGDTVIPISQVTKLRPEELGTAPTVSPHVLTTVLC